MNWSFNSTITSVSVLFPSLSNGSLVPLQTTAWSSTGNLQLTSPINANENINRDKKSRTKKGKLNVQTAHFKAISSSSPTDHSARSVASRRGLLRPAVLRSGVLLHSTCGGRRWLQHHLHRTAWSREVEPDRWQQLSSVQRIKEIHIQIRTQTCDADLWRVLLFHRNKKTKFILQTEKCQRLWVFTCSFTTHTHTHTHTYEFLISSVSSFTRHTIQEIPLSLSGSV